VNLGVLLFLPGGKLRRTLSVAFPESRGDFPGKEKKGGISHIKIPRIKVIYESSSLPKPSREVRKGGTITAIFWGRDGGKRRDPFFK